MKAFQYHAYGGPEVLELVQVADPAPGPRDVVVAVSAAGVNPVDAKIRSGALERYFPMKFPVIPGKDGAGTVLSVGDKVSEFSPGDRVCFISSHPGQGTYAEQVAVDADWLAAMPSHLDFEQAAAYPTAAVSAWSWLCRAFQVKPGMKILIHGAAGGVGGLSVQLATHLGAEVTGTCSSGNVDYVLGLGAAHVIAYDQEDFARLPPEFDAVFDSIGGDVHRRSYQVLKKGGVLVYLIAAPIEDLSEDFGVTTRMALVSDQGELLRKVTELVADRVLVPQVGKVLPLAQAAEAHRLVETGRARGKLVLLIDG